jgi:hypothetical protein
MKFLDLALIAGAAYLILRSKTATATTTTTTESTNTGYTGFSGYSGSTIPGTSIPTSNLFQQKLNEATAVSSSGAAVQVDAGTLLRVLNPIKDLIDTSRDITQPTPGAIAVPLKTGGRTLVNI